MKNNKIMGMLNLVVGIILTIPLVIIFVNSGQVSILGLFIIPLFDLVRGTMMMKGNYKLEDSDSEILLSLLPMLWAIVLVYFFFAARISYLWYVALAFPAILLVILKKKKSKDGLVGEWTDTYNYAFRVGRWVGRKLLLVAGRTTW